MQFSYALIFTFANNCINATVASLSRKALWQSGLFMQRASRALAALTCTSAIRPSIRVTNGLQVGKTKESDRTLRIVVDIIRKYSEQSLNHRDVHKLRLLRHITIIAHGVALQCRLDDNLNVFRHLQSRFRITN